MRLAIVLFLALVLAAVSTQGYFILRERNQLKAEVPNLNSRLSSLNKENENLKADIEYFSRPENLEKELRAKFNYKKPDEKLMIVVP
ncbi:septum formation initiator family protein [Candidatus Wolfebacteria bacterium]|nr:septum formation initiator family protein [Candidatus Wolfebacteria bacterium]